jgi:hypothetical protein
MNKFLNSRTKPTHSITFNFDRFSDENASALIAMAEIFEYKPGRDEFSFSCLQKLGFIADAFFDSATEIRRELVEEMDQEEKCHTLANRFRSVANLLDGLPYDTGLDDENGIGELVNMVEKLVGFASKVREANPNSNLTDRDFQDVQDALDKFKQGSTPKPSLPAKS